ncbi:MAG: hypothetical protein PHT07_15180 [Paludibacter sp.]|nr:hypothetical protein [Paludibacter sp.]
MATYTAILISVNNVGGTDVTLQEQNGIGTVNQLLATTGNEPLVVDSVDIFSLNTSQVQQPIEFIKRALNGDEKSLINVPPLSIYQLNNTIKGVDAKKFSIDENTYINYTIEGNTFVRLTLNINKKDREILSYTKMLDKANKSNIFNVVIKELGFREPDEIPTWDGDPSEDYRELEEIRFFPATGEGSTEYKPTEKQGNGLGIALLLVAASLVTFIAGKGKGMYKFKI